MRRAPVRGRGAARPAPGRLTREMPIGGAAFREATELDPLSETRVKHPLQYLESIQIR